jgi:BED zinc finger
MHLKVKLLKTLERENLEVWQHFKKGIVQTDGFYDAICNYCGQVYQMGNQRGTGSLKHHWTKTYMKRLNKCKLDKL